MHRHVAHRVITIALAIGAPAHAKAVSARTLQSELADKVRPDDGGTSCLVGSAWENRTAQNYLARPKS